MKNNDRHIIEILNYTGRKMSVKDRYAFERKMEADPFLKDAVDGYLNWKPAEIEQELALLHSQIRDSKKTRVVPIWMRAAASVLLLFGVATLYMIDQDNEKSNLFSDKVELKKVEKELINKPIETEIEEQEEERSFDSSVSHETSEETETPTLSSAKEDTHETPMARKKMAKVRIEEKDRIQDVDMALRYEDTAVGVERDLVGRIAGVSVNDVQGEMSDEPIEIKIRGIASYRDTTSTSFRGRVVDEQGIPLPGVSVLNSLAAGGSSQAKYTEGTITDFDGNFEIQAPKSGAVLELSFIGFKNQLAVAKDDSVGELVMESQQLALDEVVAVGYGVQRKKDISNEDSSAKSSLRSTSALDMMLLPEPEISLRKLKKEIERSLYYPHIGKREKKHVSVIIYVSTNGVVKDVKSDSDLDNVFMLKLERKLKASKWLAPTVNNLPVESSRRLSFEFSGR